MSNKCANIILIVSYNEQDSYGQNKLKSKSKLVDLDSPRHIVILTLWMGDSNSDATKPMSYDPSEPLCGE